MRSSIRGLFAIFGSALIAFSLCGSTWRPHINSGHSSLAERALFEQGRRLYQADSAQGETLPGAGLMGLTRAWIAAGARSVIATRWDVPDDAAAAMMAAFYAALRSRPRLGPAFSLQQAQRGFLKSGSANRQPADRTPAVWGAWFLLGRE